LVAITVRIFGGPQQGLQVSTAEAAAGTTLRAFLAGLAGGEEPGRAFAGRAILLNGASAAAEAWDGLRLEDGDVISIIPMLVGG
jgi:molybdopterin converting factor small subunit